MAKFPYHRASASISECGLYRYRLSRGVGHGMEDDYVNFILLNPSSADSEKDDPTIRRLRGFALDWGYPNFVVTNLFAFRSDDPRKLIGQADPVGPDNDRVIAEVARGAKAIVCGWGAMGPLSSRADRREPWYGPTRAANVLALLVRLDKHPMAWGLTANGQPGHPLYVHGDRVCIDLLSHKDAAPPGILG